MKKLLCEEILSLDAEKRNEFVANLTYPSRVTNSFETMIGDTEDTMTPEELEGYKAVSAVLWDDVTVSDNEYGVALNHTLENILDHYNVRLIVNEETMIGALAERGNPSEVYLVDLKKSESFTHLDFQTMRKVKRYDRNIVKLKEEIEVRCRCADCGNISVIIDSRSNDENMHNFDNIKTYICPRCGSTNKEELGLMMDCVGNIPELAMGYGALSAIKSIINVDRKEPVKQGDNQEDWLMDTYSLEEYISHDKDLRETMIAMFKPYLLKVYNRL